MIAALILAVLWASAGGMVIRSTEVLSVADTIPGKAFLAVLILILWPFVLVGMGCESLR